jgi:autophagy-related protein 9
MTNVFRLGTGSRASRSFYEQLRSEDDDDDLEQGLGHEIDEENFRETLQDLHHEDMGGSVSRWNENDEPPASLLVEHNLPQNTKPVPRSSKQDARRSSVAPQIPRSGPSITRATQSLRPETDSQPREALQPRSILAGRVLGGAKEKALWRWVNTSNLDSFINDVYDYFEGGGIWCILCSRALWLLYVPVQSYLMLEQT